MMNLLTKKKCYINQFNETGYRVKKRRAKAIGAILALREKNTTVSFDEINKARTELRS